MHYKKGEYRDQYVIAYITDFNSYKDVINWSIKFCNLLKKGLILLHISDSKYTNVSTNEAQEKLKQINDNISLPFIHSYAALSGKTKDIINSIGELLNAVMIVTKVDKNSEKTSPIFYNNILKDFYTSRIAYFVFDNYDKSNNFHDVVLSMNAMKECKEKILWASYFGRFAKSVTHIFYRRYKDEYLQKQLNLNIGFLRKMFRRFDIQTLNAHCMDKRNKLDVQAMEYAKNNSCSLCIFQTTKNKSFIELFSGLPERLVLKNIDFVPILFLNQRDDLFVMCE